MYTLRCTARLLRRLRNDPRAAANAGQSPSTTLLGDWYATPLNIGRHRLILCTNERSLLTVVAPAKNLPELPERLRRSVLQLLVRIGVSIAQTFAEVGETHEVRFDRTANRSVLGSMNEFRYSAEGYFQSGEAVVFLDNLDIQLSRTPCEPLSYDYPMDRARKLLCRRLLRPRLAPSPVKQAESAGRVRGWLAPPRYGCDLLAARRFSAPSA